MATTDAEHLRETLESRQTVFEGRRITVSVDQVLLPSGRLGRRELVRHPGAVAIVATDATERVVMVRQWRYPAGGPLWELPAGTRETNEEPLLTAQRELAEETGYSADSWELLGRGYTAPGFSSEEMFFYRSTGLHGGAAHPDEDELLDVELMELSRIAELVRRDEVDVKTIAGLALAGLTLR